MGLKVWLPLNGTLDNQGTSDLIFTAASTNTTMNTSGKIGACYTNNSHSAGGLISDKPILLGTQYSMCCWFKFTDLEASSSLGGGLISQHRYSKNTGFGLTIRYVSSTTGYLSVNTGTGSSRTYNTYYGTTLLQANTWYHACGTYDGTNIKIYLNGVLEKTQAYTMSAPEDYLTIFCWSLSGNSGATIHGDYKLNGALNDVRVYDHCLSAAEVREISQGLVLHYKLDILDIQSGTNLVTGVTAGGRTTVLADGRVGVQTTGVNQDTYFTINLSENIVAGTSYLFTCDASGISNGQYWGFPLGAQGNSGVLPFKIYNGHNVYPFTANSTKSDGTAMDWGTKRLFMDDNYRGDWANQACFYNFQLIKIGASDTIIKVEDSSGYNRNGTIIGTATLVSSPRYSFGTAMNNTSTANRIEYEGLPTETQTVSLWVKGNKSTSQVYFTDKNSTLQFGIYNSLGTTNISSKPLYNLDNFISNEWNHIVVIKNSTNNKLYINGIAATTSSSSNYYAHSAKLYLFNRNTNNNYACNGAISDFRAYATALTDDQIRQLYEVGAKVDNKGNLHTFELSESNNGRELLAVPLTTSYSNHTNVYTNYDANGEITLTGGSSVGSHYIKIYPTGNTYYYDFEVSIDAGNQIYIGFERYDAAKTSRSNSACMYAIGFKPSTALSHAHYHGTINIGTPFDANTPVDTIAVRILNDWSGANGRSMTVHKISLREVSSLQNTKINKQGQAVTTEIIEMNDNFRVHKNGIIETNEIIEL